MRDEGKEKQIIRRMTNQGLTLTTVESCTGGMIAARLTDVPGSSAVFKQGFVTYCDEAKHRLVGVKRSTLKNYTAVSAQTAAEMAKGGAAAAGADAAVSVTGYAGPADPDGKEEVGLVYIGCRVGRKTWVKECHFPGDRQAVREQAVRQALALLYRHLPEAGA